MGKETGIKWTDSTSNPWHGCMKVGPACDHCYAEGVNNRTGGGNWGAGAPRRQTSLTNRQEPLRWQKKADAFFAEHGRRQRVFTLSMGDLFDNEVDPTWRMDHMEIMERCDKLEWQVCTKRIGNLEKMAPLGWRPDRVGSWPQHIGVMVTIVTQAEADRDVPKLLDAKYKFGIPWVGISYEPAQEYVDFSEYLQPYFSEECLDWIVFGGKSGRDWNDRPFDVDWGRRTAVACERAGTAFFFKQVAAFRPDDSMIPPDLLIRQWPKGH